MNLDEMPESSNVEDVRGSGGGGRYIFGGGIGAVVIGVIIYLLGGNPSQVLQQQQAPVQSSPQSVVNDSIDHFTRKVLGSTEVVWDSIFSSMGSAYTKPKLRLYDNVTETSCGEGSSATGPFYCPIDEKVYLDGSFFKEMKDRFQVAGNFSMAYVIAHEVGHHVQHLLGITDKVQHLRSQADEKQSNRLSVKLELQADYFAGVWAHHAAEMEDMLRAGDIESAINAASAVGDDRLQQQTQGRIVPDAFTHGTSAQRVYWFKKGFETGDINQGDTFKELASN